MDFKTDYDITKRFIETRIWNYIKNNPDLPASQFIIKRLELRIDRLCRKGVKEGFIRAYTKKSVDWTWEPIIHQFKPFKPYTFTEHPAIRLQSASDNTTAFFSNTPSPSITSPENAESVISLVDFLNNYLHSSFGNLFIGLILAIAWQLFIEYRSKKT